MLVSNWRKVVILSFSFWAQVSGLLVLIVPEVVYVTTGVDSDPVLLWWVGVLLLLTGLIGRLFNQTDRKSREWGKIVSIFILIGLLGSLASNTAQASQCKDVLERESQALDISVPLISRWEGLRLDAYLDIVDVPTICYGSTRGIEMGMRKSKEECDELLREEVSEYRAGWLGYVTADTYTDRLPATRDAAYTSLAYNVGIIGAGRSTATRRLNAGDIKGGCHAIGWWNKAGQRVVRGLVNRRKDETRLCLME